ncbi:MAG TPA: pseudouridine synthase [Candidatus Saccharimonadales bacterium]|nr:pseudouridine synthase [Candidatus Saccharimonadales bacterium]
MTEHDTSAEVRLNKHIASALAIGRRQVDTLIEKGKIKVNGRTPELGARVHPGDVITVDGKPLDEQAQPFLYLALNKPAGYICSRRQQGDTPTIYRLLPENYRHLKPVGRLDKESSGLLLLTNDGDFAHRMTHPRFIKVKQYEVGLSQPLEPLHRQMISDYGISLPDGPSKLDLARLEEGNDKIWIVTMHEGRNRQIRRTFGALGYYVRELHRTHFGPYNIGELKEGEFKLVDKR